MTMVTKVSPGVVKVTPAHDPKDFECGQRHNLPEKEVIDRYGKMCGEIDERFLHLDRFQARKQVVEELQAMGLYVDKVRAWQSHAEPRPTD
jgi:valyl-tRNA synthetase